MFSENSKNLRGLTVETEEQFDSQTPKNSYTFKEDDPKDYSEKSRDIKA
jgi:hypothetical protein